MMRVPDADHHVFYLIAFGSYASTDVRRTLFGLRHEAIRGTGLHRADNNTERHEDEVTHRE